MKNIMDNPELPLTTEIKQQRIFRSAGTQTLQEILPEHSWNQSMKNHDRKNNFINSSEIIIFNDVSFVSSAREAPEQSPEREYCLGDLVRFNGKSMQKSNILKVYSFSFYCLLPCAQRVEVTAKDHRRLNKPELLLLFSGAHHLFPVGFFL